MEAQGSRTGRAGVHVPGGVVWAFSKDAEGKRLDIWLVRNVFSFFVCLQVEPSSINHQERCQVMTEHDKPSSIPDKYV